MTSTTLNILAGLFVIQLIAVLFADPVTALPWGIDEPFRIMVNTFNAIANIAPWLATVLNVFIIGLTVKVMLWVFSMTLWFIQLIRG